MIRLKNETEDLLLSKTNNFETPIKQTHTKPQETLEFKLLQQRETFHFNPPFSIEGSWMIGLLNIEVYTTIFNKTVHNNKLEFCTDNFDEF